MFRAHAAHHVLGRKEDIRRLALRLPLGCVPVVDLPAARNVGVDLNSGIKLLEALHIERGLGRVAGVNRDAAFLAGCLHQCCIARTRERREAHDEHRGCKE